jgi:hypothetical protein
VIKNDQKIRTQQFHYLKQDTQAVKICYYNTYVTEYIRKIFASRYGLKYLAGLRLENSNSALKIAL